MFGTFGGRRWKSRDHGAPLPLVKSQDFEVIANQMYVVSLQRSIPQSESRVIKWQAHQFVRGIMQRRGDQLQEDLRTRRGRISRRSAPRSTPRTTTTTSTMLNWKTRPPACLQRSENVSSLTWFVQMFVSIWPE